jgi:hypothetical protein
MYEMRLSVLNAEGMVVRVNTLAEALKIGVDTYYIVGSKNSVYFLDKPWASDTLQDMSSMLEIYEDDMGHFFGEEDIIMLPATEKLRKRCINDDIYREEFSAKYPGFSPSVRYFINSDGFADWDEVATTEDEERTGKFRRLLLDALEGETCWDKKSPVCPECKNPTKFIGKY